MEAMPQPTDRFSHTTRLIYSDRPAAQIHGRGTARVAIDAALALGFSERSAGRIGLAAALHDIGKKLISERILNKPGPLSPDEWTQIRLHPILGEQMLVGEGLLDIAPWVRSHHERVDGLGYPDGLFGDQIPVESRLFRRLRRDDQPPQLSARDEPGPGARGDGARGGHAVLPQSSRRSSTMYCE